MLLDHKAWKYEPDLASNSLPYKAQEDSGSLRLAGLRVVASVADICCIGVVSCERLEDASHSAPETV
jgi:hypothetical protein